MMSPGRNPLKRAVNLWLLCFIPLPVRSVTRWSRTSGHYAQEYKDGVVFARLNIMTNLWTAERYGVRSTPTFKFFCDGKPVREMVGAVYPALLKKIVDEVLIHGKECAKNSTTINYDITGYG